jgi:hypothetical protein
MASIEEFPDGDDYWVIKWVDGFTLPHLGTQSPSVTVLLQKLDITSHAQLNRLTRDHVWQLLGRNPGSAPPDDRHRTVHVLTGLLPHLVIGRVFHQKRYVGELPSRPVRLALPNGEESGHELTLDASYEPPSGWNSAFPYKLLHTAEYDGVSAPFSRSRCFVYAPARQNVEFIVPRTVIFQTFYAPQRDLALAFTSGPWNRTKKLVVWDGDLDSGLKTGIDPISGHWHVVLHASVKDGFAPLVALLLFDSTARNCADAIYTQTINDRGNDMRKPWFASARFPFANSNDPLTLRVKGISLSPRLGRMVPDGTRPELKRSILVTAITASSWPTDLPEIGWEKLNSGEKGDEIVQVGGDRPYSKYPGSRPAGSQIQITSTEDALISEWDQEVQEDTFSWLNPPVVYKIPKQRSKQYTGSGSRLSEDSDPTTTSPGLRTHQRGNVAPVNSQVVVRDPINRFTYLLDALEACKKDGIVSDYSIFQPEEPSQRIMCNGVPCWNFLSREERSSGNWPKVGWVVMPRTQKGKRRSPRAALVVRVSLSKKVGYWIEIEASKGEGSLLSMFMTSVPPPEDTVIQNAIEIIASMKGRNLREVAAGDLTGHRGMRVRCYTHRYAGNNGSELDPQSVRRFLERCQAEKAPVLT